MLAIHHDSYYYFLQTVEDLGRSVACISPDGDIIAIANSKGKEGKPHDQLLYDSFVSIH